MCLDERNAMVFRVLSTFLCSKDIRENVGLTKKKLFGMLWEGQNVI